MKFSVKFWNIENLGKYDLDQSFEKRIAEVTEHIRQDSPDVVGFCEIHDKIALRSLLTKQLSDYDFSVTDGKEGIEILAGWKRGRFEQVIVTQRREFKADSENLRPGSLISLKNEGQVYNILFLHTDSGTRDKDYTNRQNMFEKIWSLKSTFDSIQLFSPTNFIALGDLNTMGKKQSGDRSAVSEESEIADLARDAEAAGMKMLKKNQNLTYNNFRYKSNLDHVLATSNLSFTDFGDGEVAVKGWVDLEGEEKKHYIENISDHCHIYLEIV